MNQMITLKELIREHGQVFGGEWINANLFDPQGNIKILQLADIGEFATKNRSSRYITEEHCNEFNYNYLQEGDIIISRLPEPIGRACIFPATKQRCITVVDACVIRISPEIYLPKLLMYFINSPAIRKQILQLASGTSRIRISQSNLLKIKIPIFTIKKQEEILKKIEDIFGQLHIFKQKLQLCKQLIQKIRITILNNAVTGNATPQSLWPSRPLDQIFSFVDYRGQSIEKNRVGIRLITAKNIRYGTMKEEPKEFITTEEFQRFMTRGIPEKGDLLLVTEGQTMGFAAIHDRDYPFAIAQRIILLKPLLSLNSQTYLYFIMSEKFQSYIKLHSSGSATVGIKASQLKKMHLPFPSKETQDEIANILTKTMNELDELEARQLKLEKLIVQIERLTLQFAFEGKIQAKRSKRGI